MARLGWCWGGWANSPNHWLSEPSRLKLSVITAGLRQADALTLYKGAENAYHK